jgi:Transcriptional regulators
VSVVAATGEPGTESVLTRVYRDIRHGVITAEFPPGMRLNEQRFAEMFNVSRPALREAMSLLERDGFIESEPRRSAVVRRWTPKRVNELFDARLALETAGAQYAAREVRGGASTAKLLASLAESDARAHLGDSLSIAEGSTQFHLDAVELSGNELLLSLMRTISHEMVWLFYLTSGRDSQTACDEHHELVDAICSGNEEVARAVAYTHIERGRKPSLSFFEGQAD